MSPAAKLSRIPYAGTPMIALITILLLAVTFSAASGMPADRSAFAPAQCDELIESGGFESGTFANWGTFGSPWIADHESNTGSYSAVVGGANNANDTVYQDVFLPADADTLTLTYWWFIFTEESLGSPADYFFVEAQDSYGTILATLETLSNAAAGEGWQQSSIDLNDHPELLGQQVRLAFHGLTNEEDFTSFYVDDVALASCGGSGQCPDWLANGSFESGDFSHWLTDGEPWMASYLAHDGENSGVVGGRDNSDDLFYQEFYLPASVEAIVLSYWTYIYTQETSGTSVDYYMTEIRDATGQEIATVHTLDNTSPTGQWVKTVVDLRDPDFTDRTVRITFHGTTNESLFTSFYIDDVQLRVCGAATPTPVAPTAEATATATLGPTGTATHTPTPIDSPTPTHTVDPGTSATPTPTPADTATFTTTPTYTPTPADTDTPTPAITATPTPRFPSCPDGYEPNDRLGAPTWPIVNAPRVSYICAPDDVDFWSLPSVAISQTMKVTLQDHPLDYSLSLLGPDGQTVILPQSPGRDEEMVVVADTAGTWHAQVLGSTSAYSDTYPYTISAELFDCALDPYEYVLGNDISQNAVEMGSVTGAGFNKGGLSICPSKDEDWFTTFVGLGHKISAEVVHNSSFDMLELCIIDPDGRTELVCTPGAANRERVEHTVRTLAAHFVRVRAAGTQYPTNREYHLHVSETGPTQAPTNTPTVTPTSTPQYPNCPDQHEPNGVWLDAKPVDGYVDSYICATDDVDWWSYKVERGHTKARIVELWLDHPGGPYALLPYAPGNVNMGLGVRTGEGNKVIASYAAESFGDAVVKVFSTTSNLGDAKRPYRLNAFVYDCPDAYEPNDQFDVPWPLPLAGGGTRTIKSHLCRAWENDFYSIDVKAGQRIAIGLTGYAPDYDITLYDQWHGMIDTGNAMLTHDPLYGGTYIVRVRSRSGLRYYSPSCYGGCRQPYELSVTLGPKPQQPSRDVRLMNIVAQQSLQNLANDAPLQTNMIGVARLFVSGGRHKVPNVKGFLEATINGKPLTPERVQCWDSTTAYGVQQIASSLRDDLRHSIECLLPMDWMVTPGNLMLTGTVYAQGTDDPNMANNRLQQTVVVERTPSMSLQMIQVRARCKDGKCTEADGPSYSDYDDVHEMIQSMYPLSWVGLYPHGSFHVEWDEDDKVFFARLAKAVSQRSWRLGTHFMGAVAKGVPSGGVVGTGEEPGRYSWVIVGQGDYSADSAAHEVGHNLRLQHIDASGCSRPDGPYTTPYRGMPYIDDGDVSNYYGMDVHANPAKLYLPRDYTDIMTYCSKNRMSHAHWYRARTSLRANSGLHAPTALEPDTEYLSIFGTIHAEKGEVMLLPITRILGGQVNPDTPTHPAGDYTLRLLDDAGGVLHEQEFALLEGNHQANGHRISLFAPAVDGFARLTLSKDDDVQHEVVRSENAPVVALSPISGTVAGEVVLEWQASDPDGDALTASVSVSYDGGATWDAVTVGLTGTSSQFDSALWPATETGLLSVQVTDGMNTAEAVTGPFNVEAKAPIVSVTTPEHLEAVMPDAPVSMSATAFDPEDGPLTGDAIMWRSDRDGALGTGAQLKVQELSPGWHLLTATVTDSSGNTADADVRIYVGSRAYLPWTNR